MGTIKTNWMKLGMHGVANVLLWYCKMLDETEGVGCVFRMGNHAWAKFT